MGRQLLEWTGFLACWIVVGGCAPTTPSAEENTATLSVDVGDDGSRSVQLPSGNRLELPGVPSMVLPTSASATDLALDLLPPERIAGLTELALKYSKLATDEELPPALASKPVMGAFEPELVLRWDPDLILTHIWQDPALLASVARNGVPSLPLPIAGEWSDLLHQIEVVARVLDVEERGRELHAELEQRRQELAQRSSGTSLRLLSLSRYGDDWWTNGANTTYDAMIGLAGQRNAAAEAGLNGNVQVRLEELLRIDPDVIFTGGGAGDTGLEALADHSMLNEMQAVREKRWIVLPGHLYSTSSHEVLRSAEVLWEGLANL